MSALLHRNLRMPPMVAGSGDGAYLVGSDGRRYLDASGGAAVSSLGHSHPHVIAAIQRQVAEMPYAHTAFFTNDPAERLAAKLISLAPSGFGRGRVAFIGSGSEAMEVALKLARQHFVERGQPLRSHFIARRMSYHGNTLGALSVGGHMQRRAMYAPMLMPVSHVSPCFAYRFRRDDETDIAYGRRVADELQAEIVRVGPERVAAFVAEPVVGATLGCVPAVTGYFTRIREICDRYGVLFIADEVMCGMGRTGDMFAIDHDHVCPDIITLGKGLGAGYLPIGATMASERVVRALEVGSGALANGHTYMSHAVACAGSLAVLESLEREQLLENVRKQGARLRAALDERFGNHPHVGDIRGRGLFVALELVVDRASQRPFARERRIAESIKNAALEHGLVCYPSSGTADGERGDHVLLAPPYIITDAQLTELVDKLDHALADVLEEARCASPAL
ncbi:MAG TPA: aspartate aminotransferase family protein [Casimicrobiaceae bacterium]|nr:aspartate aminotransferase family protein [Casimicrobiaceae bacterium]